ncbi:hypothetical protein NM688_g4285 [Phlebia brevispora]|uniref:Uncharacterized protein n=1 Tax=Phlebia brevispora TaxID=194682 RepID=A0ACC1T3E9_9APHY|nr:hypothetical protein NM688_g4285 [Phlebia brevispora]
MKSLAAAVALAVVAPAALAQQTVTVNSLSAVVQCRRVLTEPIKFTWSGGTPPYYLSLIPAEQPQAPPMKIFPTQQGTSYTWIVDMAAGTAFTTVIKDSTGQPNYSSEQVVQNGTDASCLNAAVTETNTSGNGPATAAPTTSGSATPSPAAAAVTGSGTSSVPHTSTSATSSGSASTPSKTAPSAKASGAALTHGSTLSAFGLAVVIAIAGAAFL